jgi:NADP-dependent 3-hydroxy acid dehydrogenase YdfG
MSKSFSTNTPLGDPQPTHRTVLVTGAAGRIGSYFAEHAQGRYTMRLMVRGDEKDIDKIRAFGEVVECELSDLEGLKHACQGIHTIIHMAGDPDPSATWQSLLDANVVGTYNVFAAAKAAGCQRVITASSIHAISGYPADVQVKTSDPVNPGDLYGVSKCFVEALSRYMAEQEGLSSIAIRIGAFQPLEAAQREESIHMLDAFVSHRDLHQLLVRCVDDDTIRFAILHGLSNNRFKRMDITTARELLGYAPEDDLTQENPKLRELHLEDKVISHNLQDGQKSGIREDVKVI